MSSILCPPEEFQQPSYDYLIIGGGTSGLVLAARQSEDPSISVGVLEAGEAQLDDPFILTPLLFTKLAGNKTYDWMLETIPQSGTNGKVHAVPREQDLGGSSAINFMIYARGERQEYDDWVQWVRLDGLG
jgi:choline dehydrogenase-like flavoprotein